MPAKADTAAQRSFYESVLKPLMKKAKRKNSSHVLLFMDASHFVHGCDFLGGVYSRYKLTRNLVGHTACFVHESIGCFQIIFSAEGVSQDDDYGSHLWRPREVKEPIMLLPWTQKTVSVYEGIGSKEDDD